MIKMPKDHWLRTSTIAELERTFKFDAFIDRLTAVLWWVVVLSIAIMLSLYVASVVLVHEIDHYTETNLMR